MIINNNIIDFNFLEKGIESPSEIMKKLEFLKKINIHSITGCFEWMDGLLIKVNKF